MKKYKYQCDNASCSKKFVDSNPSNCPHCTSDDFTLIGESNKLWLWLTIVALAIVGIVLYLIPPDKKIAYTYQMKENYIQINVVEGYDFNPAHFVLTDKTNNTVLYNVDNKFYPCDGSGINITIECSDPNLNGDTIIPFYRFPENEKANEKFCNKESEEPIGAPVFLSKGVKREDGTCGIRIYVDNSDKVEYSLNNKTFFPGKYKWKKQEVGKANKVYVRFVGQLEVSSKAIPKCVPPPESDSPADKAELKSLLKAFLKDHTQKDPFMNWQRKKRIKVSYYVGSDSKRSASAFGYFVTQENDEATTSNWSVSSIDSKNGVIVKVKIKK